MARIYLDTNVFSNLRIASQPRYQMLLKLINERKDRMSFYFSMAHIRDKRKDLSEMKLHDFEFMELFVGDNYLAYDPIEKKTSFYLATPKMTFLDDNPDEFGELLDFFNSDIVDASSPFNSLFSIATKFDQDLFINLPEDQKKLLAAFLPIHNPEATFLDQVRSGINFSQDLHRDADLYKELRAMVGNGFDKCEFTINDDFNEAFRNTPFKKTYLEYIRDSMFSGDNKEIPAYDLFIQAYYMLDVMGISKDKITKKNTLGNIQNDGFHAYFASYCDYFITDDKSTIAKSNAIYKLFDKNTKVVTVDEFSVLLPEIIDEVVDDFSSFFRKLQFDIEFAERKFIENFEGKMLLRLTNKYLYLDFFDAILQITSENVCEFVMFRSEVNLLSEPSFSEMQKIIERAIYVFGEDWEKKMHFDYHGLENRLESVTNRKWELGKLVIELSHHPLVDFKYALVVRLPRKE